MANSSVSRTAWVWVVIAVVLGAYSWWLSGQIDASRTQLAESQARERHLIVQVQNLATQIGREPGSAPDSPDGLTLALLRRPDLIPFDPVMGGTFYFLEQSVRVLSTRYLYVRVEDGHIQGHLLLRYSTSGVGRFEFSVVEGYLD